MFDNTYICKVCGKPFAAKRKAMYCSVACKSKAQYHSTSGKKSRFARMRCKWRIKPKTYAEIKEHNEAHPIVSGWRGQVGEWAGRCR